MEKFPETSEEDAGAMLISNGVPHVVGQECRKFRTTAGSRVEKHIRFIRGTHVRNRIYTRGQILFGLAQPRVVL